MKLSFLGLAFSIPLMALSEPTAPPISRTVPPGGVSVPPPSQPPSTDPENPPDAMTNDSVGMTPPPPSDEDSSNRDPSAKKKKKKKPLKSKKKTVTPPGRQTPTATPKVTDPDNPELDPPIESPEEYEPPRK